MAKAKLVKRKVYTPMGKPDGHTYDLYVGNRLRTSAMSYNMGRKFVKKINKK